MTETVTIIIPFVNESDNIPGLVTALNNYCDGKIYRVNVIFVDDGSTDNSISVLAQQECKSFSGRLISLSTNFGSHAAVRAGLKHTDSDFCIFLPADLQDPLTLIDDCLREMKSTGSDIVFACRKTVKNKLSEKLFSRFYSYLMINFVSPNYPVKGFDVVFFKRKVTELLNQNAESNSSIFIQILTLGFKQARIEYDKTVRRSGVSKWTLSKKIKLLIDSFVAFSYTPIRFVSLIGFLFFFVGIIWTLYIITRKIVWDDLAYGWPALISILLLGFGITNISLGIIAEYLWRTLDSSRKRPVFIIDKVIDLNNK